ncbi:hypothetical protein BG011_000087 [Mortierella polycephala]|uniref:Dbl homology domain-containing protein n=1 Tax=Mortierella polycephala TaxID=41804 RepID=A0A9P6QAY8_9FUNG|nr:hypothetical protein BG011_000087 [Mortierella polycephala]
MGGLPRRLDPSPHHTLSTPQYPSRQQSHHYQSLNTHAHVSHNQQQQQQNERPPNGLTEDEYEQMEDRRRIQQLILRDKLHQAENSRQPDPAMSVKTTSNTGFALGSFDMSESLAIVEDLLDYFGEDDFTNDEFPGQERFNETQLMEAERTHLQRESFVRYLYDSEEDYLRSLEEIQTCYQKPFLLNLQNAEISKKSSLLGSSKAVATKQDIDTLFGNLDQLISFHKDIRSLLEARSKIWGPTQIMSDLLLSITPRFKMYSKYYSNFHAALTILDRISRTGHYKKFIEQCVADNPPGTASLHLMLAFPLRRLSAYRDLISAICQATQSSHPDHINLMRALDQASAITNELKIEYLMAQDQLALWDIQSTMVGLPEPIMIPARRLILRADLHKVDTSLALEPRTYYLMNDVLLYARFDPKKNIYTFKGMFDLAKTQINNPEDNVTLPQLPNCVQIANSGRNQMMRCRSREERDYWMSTMRQTIEIVNKSLGDPSASVGDVLPLRKYANSIASQSSASLGQYPGTASDSTKSSNRTYADSRSINSKSSSETQSSTGKPRKPNPQADFYGCSFGTDISVPNSEDNYRPSPLALSHAMSNNSSSSSVSTGVTSSSSTSKPGLGAMLAAIPAQELTPKQAKAKAALAAAVEARRQARLKKEMKNGGPAAKSEMNKDVNLDFSSSFIPAKERIAKSAS